MERSIKESVIPAGSEQSYTRPAVRRTPQPAPPFTLTPLTPSALMTPHTSAPEENQPRFQVSCQVIMINIAINSIDVIRQSTLLSDQSQLSALRKEDHHKGARTKNKYLRDEEVEGVGVIKQIMRRRCNGNDVRDKKEVVDVRDKKNEVIKKFLDEVPDVVKNFLEKGKSSLHQGEGSIAKDEYQVEAEKPADNVQFGSEDIRYKDKKDLGAKPKRNVDKTDGGKKKTKTKVELTINNDTKDERASSDSSPADPVKETKRQVKFDLPKDYVEKDKPSKQDKYLVPCVVPSNESLVVSSKEDYVLMRIPMVVTTPRLPLRGGNHDKLASMIKKYIWDGAETPPDFCYPRKVVFFSKEGDEFGMAIEDLLNQDRIGLSAARVKVNGRWRIRYLACSTYETVYIFDVDYFGANLFWWGMYDVLGKEN